MKQGNSIKTLNSIHKALLAGQILFIVVCIFLVSAKIHKPVPEGQARVYQVVAIVLSGTAFFVGTSLFKKKILFLRNMQADVKEKFALYRSASIFQWALLEGACLFNAICFFITSNYAFVALVAVLILLFSMLAPSKAKIAFQLGLREDELDDL